MTANRRKCKSCSKFFSGDVGFVTCPACRTPLEDDGGGCHFWHYVNVDHRTRKLQRLPDGRTCDSAPLGIMRKE